MSEAGQVPYFPQMVFSRAEGSPMRVLAAPQRYVQGPGVLDDIGKFVAGLEIKRVGVLASPGGRERFGERLEGALREAGIELTYSEFRGECSLEQIEGSAAELSGSDEAKVDGLIALGGGKCVDAGKAIAHRLSVPAIIVPTLASTDAPCSALSVLYTPDGVMSGVEFYPENPAYVVMDTEIILKAPRRYLVAGMADALATWYEARVCLENPAATSTLGARPTLLAATVGKLCSDTIYENAEGAIEAINSGSLNEAFERIVEANTLHSGIGFESGGLAGAHALAGAITAIERVETNMMHGEMVALGILTQLILEGNGDEHSRALDLYTKVGLPVHLGQFGLDWEEDGEDLSGLASRIAGDFLLQNFSFEIGEKEVSAALRTVDDLGKRHVAAHGEKAFAELHLA